MRHAQSTWNAEGRWQGHADPPLSTAGVAQAAAARGRWGLSFDLVISSDLKRAQRTAHLLSGGGPAARSVVLTDLREYDVGAWSGLTRAAIEAAFPGDLERYDQGLLAHPPGAEERDAFDARVERAFAEVAALVSERDAVRTLVVTHGGVIRALLRQHGLRETRIGHLAGIDADVHDGGLVLGAAVDLMAGGAPGGGDRVSSSAPPVL